VLGGTQRLRRPRVQLPRRAGTPEAWVSSYGESHRGQLVRPGSLLTVGPRSLDCTELGCRLAGALDAFLLKFAIEEVFGYPTQLVSDGLNEELESTLNLTGPESVYLALAAGEADMYPEVCL
jgi:hypothetical protein